MVSAFNLKTILRNNINLNRSMVFGVMGVHVFYKFYHAWSVAVILLNIFPPNILKVFTYQSNMILILYIMNVTQ